MTQSSASLSRTGRRRRLAKEARYHLTALAFVLPWVLGFIIFLAYPLVASLRMSLTNYQLLEETCRYVGLKNYAFMFTRDPIYLKAIKNTVTFAVLEVPLRLLIALGIAVLLNTRVRFLGLWRTLFFLPSLVPPVATVVVFKALFDPGRGVVNAVLGRVGLPQPGWFAAIDTALYTIVLMSAWGFGGAMIILLAGLQDVPRELLEAAQMDGAGAWARFCNVTLPTISPVLFFNLTLGLIGAFQVFTQSIVLGGATGWPGGSTMFYSVYIYSTSFGPPYRMAYGAAMGWVLFAMILGVTGLNFAASKRFVFYLGE